MTLGERSLLRTDSRTDLRRTDLVSADGGNSSGVPWPGQLYTGLVRASSEPAFGVFSDRHDLVVVVGGSAGDDLLRVDGRILT